MSRSSKRLFASLGVLGVVAGGLFLANQYTDGDGASSSSPDATASSTEAGPVTHTYASNGAAGHLDQPEAFGGETPRYRADQVMVRLVEGASITSVAQSFGSAVVERGSRSGYATLTVPAGMTPQSFLSELGRDPMVGAAIPNGIIRGAGGCGDFKGKSRDRASEYQWHLDAMGAPNAGKIDVSDIIVAVIDTGVAYESHSDASGTYTQAITLAGSEFVAPYDFVNDDGHANDDNQHGTHIASLIASDGAVEGSAPGASIMPIKVLDSDNSGTELDLIEAIYHAVDNGADVINMSLSFAPGYMPSAALLEALQYAAEAQVVMVGASGNNGDDVVTYPAASPLVLAVGAADRAGEPAYYSNRGNRVDIMAPGGDLTADLDGNGIADGMVAETILPGDPSQTGLYMYAGTSQASAVVSGAVANMLAMGALPEEIAPALMWGASKNTGRDHGWYDDALGAGPIDADKSGQATCRVETSKFMPRNLGATVLPYLVDNGDGTLTPTARVTVIDLDGDAVKRDEVFVSMSGTQRESLSCRLDSDGICTVQGTPYTPGADGEGFAFYVASVVDKGIISRPRAVAYASDAFEVMTAAMQQEGLLEGALLGVQWEAGPDADLGQLAEALSVVNMGSGLASSPLGFVFSAPSLSSYSQPVSVNLDGSGLASSPLGFMTVNLYSFSGSGLASSPLGFFGMPIVGISGTGLASSPLGFHSLSLYSSGTQLGTIDGSGLASSPLGFTGLVMDFSTSSFTGSGLASSPLGFSATLGTSGSFSMLSGSGLASSPLGFTATGSQFQTGGWASYEDTEGASVTLLGSGLASSPLGFYSFSSVSLGF